MRLFPNTSIRSVAGRFFSTELPAFDRVQSDVDRIDDTLRVIQATMQNAARVPHVSRWTPEAKPMEVLDGGSGST